MRVIEIEYLKPFLTKLEDGILTLTFAYKHLTISRNGEAFDFTPMLDRKIIINLADRQIENIDDVFVFKNSERFIRLPIYQLLLASNVFDFLMPFIEDAMLKEAAKKKQEKPATQRRKRLSKEARELIRELEEENVTRLIESALLNNDKVLFEQLMKLKKRGHGGQSNG